MSILQEQKTSIIADFKLHESDKGSSHVQCAVLTANINLLVQHLRAHKHDHSSRRGLIAMVNKRRKLLQYLHKKSPSDYQALRERLDIRDVIKIIDKHADHAGKKK